ncbi:MAG: hypothetical protein U0168_13485 [Nannocystaceae bacterium]
MSTRSCRRATPSRTRSSTSPARTRSRCCAAPTPAARAASPSIVRVDASIVSVHKEILVVDSAGAMAYDQQPMVRFGTSVIAPTGGERTEQAAPAVAIEQGLSYFDRVSPEDMAARPPASRW